MSPLGTGPARRSRFEVALEALRSEVEAGRFAAGAMLPGERDLAERLGVSRTTLRRVLAVLVEEGRLTHRQGVGTFAAGGETAPSLAGRLTGFADDMAARGCAASSREVARAVVRPSPDEIMALACSPDEPVLRLTRVLYADEQPIGIECAAVPCRLIGAPERAAASLGEALGRHGCNPVRALQRVQAAILSDVEAGRLGVPPASAGLVIRRAAYLADGRCCEVSRTIYRADRYDLVSELRGSAQPASDPRA